MTGADEDPCPACGAPLAAEALGCDGCGLRFAGEDEPPPPQEGEEPAPRGLGGGWLVLPGPAPGPAILAEAPAPLPAPPPPPAPPWRRRLVGLTLVGLVAAGAAVALREPSDPLLRLEARLGRLCGPPGPRVAAAFDPDALLRAEAEDAPALEAARRAHRTLPAAATLHHLHAAWLERDCDLEADEALAVGRHPHPLATTEPPLAQRTFARRLVAREVWDRLVAWPEADLGPHDRLDLAALRLQAELALRSAAGDDVAALWGLSGAFDPLVRLEAIDCCPAADRAAAAAALLERAGKRLEQLAARLRRPARAHLLSTLRHLADADEHLAAPTGLPATAALDAARARARAAIGRVRDRLQGEVLPRADGPLGVGRDELALVLARRHRLERTPEELLREAVAAMRTARLDAERPRLDRGQGDPPLEVEAFTRPEAALAAVAAPPRGDPGPAVQPPPPLWRHANAEAFLLVPGILAPSSARPAVFVAPHRLGADPEVDRLRRAHVLAHEVAPGHHLAWGLARESACLLRQDHDDVLHHEGWAVLAEELFHDAGACGGGSADGWLRATERWGSAWGAALDLLVHAQAAPEEELLGLLRLVDPQAELADLGDRVAEPGAGAAYLLGPAELRRVRDAARRRPGFDPRAFHERLLRLGPVPPALVAAELAAGR